MTMDELIDLIARHGWRFELSGDSGRSTIYRATVESMRGEAEWAATTPAAALAGAVAGMERMTEDEP